ncbi:MAG: M20 family metallopeptidase [Proteobacteria bacterium]|nr:M20 family metallopeptidase [Pseudomonadota bacterium]MBU1583014.1 M20 family metallopeptidase [Pseudomonadota bacterium]MBU2454782.1 M20 family metallopeptidase [Pseudomonadota bacterium]MBU2627950.1 M20 family metallopeptidase [Pseudomonadota bacterium]
MENLKDTINRYYNRYRDDIETIVQKIHSTPELSEQETMACKLQVELLENWQFDIQKKYKGIDTAFNARFGKGRPNICIMSEYDALPGIGHGCGHNLIAGVALGTGIVLKELIVKNHLKGCVTVMGTPAEEKRGCKIDLLRAGALEDVDLVLMAHPSDHATSQSMEEAGVMQFLIRFKGRSAHAAAGPEKGLNALDAVRLLFNGVDAWRQQLPETCRIHGVIKDGGKAPNIIPDDTLAEFYLRSFDSNVLLSMKNRFENIAKGAALMTDTTVTVEEISHSYKPGKPNNELNKAFMKLADEYGMKPEWLAPSRASSDFGDVTYEVPAMHAFFNITGENKEIAIHSKNFTQCAASAHAMEQMGKTIKILSQIGFMYLTRKAFRTKVLAAFPFGKKTKE